MIAGPGLRRIVVAAAAAFFMAILVVPVASAEIIKIQSAKTCNVIGLDPSPEGSQGGVHCDVGNTAFSLSAFLNGSIQFFVGNGSTPSWNLINDTGATLTDLTLFYSGALDSGAVIDVQISGTTLFQACAETTPANVTTPDSDCGMSDIAPAPVTLPLKLVWSGWTGVAANGVFNLATASFAHAGAGAGCISGTSNCRLVSTPVPSSLPLLVMGLLGIAVANSRFRRLFWKNTHR